MNVCRTCTILSILIFLNVVAEGIFQSSQGTTYNILNGTCQEHSECSQIYSRCINNRCRCIEGYIALDSACVLNTGNIGDTCKIQKDCKALFSYCNEKKICQCINGSTPAGQDCALKKRRKENENFCSGEIFVLLSRIKELEVENPEFPNVIEELKHLLSDGEDRCQNNLDCSHKQFSSCNKEKCICNGGYYLQGATCVPDDAIIGDVCTFNENCKIANSVCRYQHCVCNENYFSQGYECVPENGYMLTKRESPSNYKSYGFACKIDRECDENMFCDQEEQKCFCRQGYSFYQGQCQFLQPSPPHSFYSSEIQNKPITLEQPEVGKPVHQALFGTSCFDDRNCDQSMTCNEVLHKCICRPGFLFFRNHCKHIYELSPHLSTYPEYRQYTPTDIYTKQIVSGNPTLQEKPNEAELPLSSKREDQTFHTTFSLSKPAHGYDNVCTSSADCLSEHLHCHPTTKRCACNNMYKLEGNNCVHHVNLELKPSGSSYKRTASLTSKVNHGNPCKANSDCYHEGLVCNPYTLRCSCAEKYYLDGDHCVTHDVSESPTIHIPDKPEPPNQPLYEPKSKREIDCTSDSSCTKPFSYCNIGMKTCDCVPGYHKFGQNCIKDGVCDSDNDCKGRNSYCVNNKCECHPDYSRSDGNDCFFPGSYGNYGKIGDFCYSDDHCSYEHSHCFQQQCQCADSFYFAHGTCQPEVDYLRGNCYPQCATLNSECDHPTSKCKCKIGYTRHMQNCVPDGELFGRCAKYNQCNKKEVLCQRSTAKCVCDKGYKVLGFACAKTIDLGTGSYFN